MKGPLFYLGAARFWARCVLAVFVHALTRNSERLHCDPHCTAYSEPCRVPLSTKICNQGEELSANSVRGCCDRGELERRSFFVALPSVSPVWNICCIRCIVVDRWLHVSWCDFSTTCESISFFLMRPLFRAMCHTQQFTKLKM